MEATIHSINLITSHPNIRGGRPCIAGTGFRVTDVVIASRYHHQTPEEIAESYSVALAGVYAALAYYYEHQTEIDSDITSQIETARRLRASARRTQAIDTLPE